MPHNGFIYEARMDMMENSGHCYTISMRLPPCEYYTAVTVGGRQAQLSRATHATHAAGLD